MLAIVTETISGVAVRLNGAVPQLGRSDAPVGQIANFDSMCAVEVTVALESLLGVDLGGNILLNKSGTRSLALDEVVNRIWSSLAGETHE